jgi:DNA-binding transcriptional ArsR family regulator
MALPSFTKHIVMLEKAGLIRTKKKGRSRLCTLQPARMAMVDRWLADHREVSTDRTAELFALSRTLYQAERTI